MLQKIEKVDQIDLDSFLNFNKYIFPNRRNLSKRFSWQYLENPIFKSNKKLNILISYDNSNNIVGQFLLSPFEFYQKNEIKKAFWGMDYHVLSENRGACGAVLARNAISKHKPYFTIGPSKFAKKISLALGAKVVGKLKKYMWFKNPLDILRYKYSKESSKNNGISDEIKFPNKILLSNATFQLTYNLQNYEDYCWDGIIQPSRSANFLKWRFLNSINKYYLYSSNSYSSPIFFVVRKCILNGMTFLLLVDFKIPFNINCWEGIIKTTKKIAKLTKCDGIITMSSHSFFEKAMLKNFFFCFGGNLEILSNIDTDDFESNLLERTFIYATMADCDVDLCVEE